MPRYPHNVAIAVETLNTSRSVRRALIDNFTVLPHQLTKQNNDILEEFKTHLDQWQYVVGVTALRAFRSTGAITPEILGQEAEVRSGHATYHEKFPIVALVTRQPVANAPYTILDVDVAARIAHIAYASGTFDTIIEIRFILCCSCDFSVHGNFIMPWSYFMRPPTEFPQLANTSILVRQLRIAQRQLESFLITPSSEFKDRLQVFQPLLGELTSILAMLREDGHRRRVTKAVVTRKRKRDDADADSDYKPPRPKAVRYAIENYEECSFDDDVSSPVGSGSECVELASESS